MIKKDFIQFVLIALLTLFIARSLYVDDHHWFWKSVLIVNLCIYIPYLLLRSFKTCEKPLVTIDKLE